MKIQAFIHIVLLGSAILVQSCGFYSAKNNGTTPSNTAINTGSGAGFGVSKVGISYSDVQSKVFTVSCTTCHSNGNAKGGVALDSYARVSAKISDGSIYRTVFTDQSMPADGPLTSDQSNLLLSWISQGAPEVAPVVTATPAPVATATPVVTATPVTTATPTPVPTATPVSSGALVATYSSIKTLVFASKCIRCHGAGGSESSRPLDNYSSMISKGLVIAGNPSNSPVVTTIEDGSMPPSGNAVTTQELTVIKQWIQNGAPNN